jgi:DivIVA domain-containing protein
MPQFDVLLRGYDQAEVDALVARIERTLGQAPQADRAVTAERVRQAHFTVVMRGYDPDAVDHAIQGYVLLLERRERDSTGQWRLSMLSTDGPIPLAQPVRPGDATGHEVERYSP